jgi:hypothetical protein
MSSEIILWHFHLLASLEIPQGLVKEVKVKGSCEKEKKKF